MSCKLTRASVQIKHLTQHKEHILLAECSSGKKVLRNRDIVLIDLAATVVLISGLVLFTLSYVT